MSELHRHKGSLAPLLPALTPLRTCRCGGGAEPAVAQWDDFVQHCSGDNLVQTTPWARLKERQGFSTQHIVVRENGVIVAGVLLVIKRLGILGSVGYVARGPLLGRRDEALTRRIVDEIEHVATRARVRHLVIQPAADGEAVQAELDRRGYTPASLSLAADATLRIDLAQTPEQLLARMSRSKRQAVRRAARGDSVVATFGGRADLGSFHRLYENTASRQGFRPLGLRDLQQRWDELAPHGHVQLVLAYAGDVPLAGIWLTACGDTVTARLTGWNRQGAGLAPNECCDWTAMLWARKHGYRYYDFGNCDRASAERMAAGEALGDDFRRSADSYKKLMGTAPLLFPTARQFTFNAAARSVLPIGSRLINGSRVLKRLVEVLRNG